MSYATTHKICTNYNGHTYNVDYWPEGEGQEEHGYVTDFEQYYADISYQIDEANVDFVIVTSDGKSKHITDTEDMRSAVQHLADRSVLFVQAVDRVYKKNKKNTDENNRKQWKQVRDDPESDSDSETETEGEEWNAKPAVTYTNTKKSGKKMYAILNRFASHSGTCHHCDETEWTGKCYTYAYSSSYSMCGKCYDDLSKTDKKDWNDSGLPWQRDVPKAPLERRDDYAVVDGVKHLQYLLTCLGHMKLSDTEQQTGSYQSKTEKGVASFREEYNIRGYDMTVYDKKTSKKLLQVVNELRNEGHQYL